MDSIIYSTSPLGTFANTFLAIGAILAFGLIGIIYAVAKPNQTKGARLGLGLAGAFLCLVGGVTTIVTFVNMATKSQTATAILNTKTIAEDTCGEDSTCKRYLLEMTAGPKSYEFTVAERAYNAALEGGCYQVTYYPNQGLFASGYGTDQYVATSYIIRIAQARPGDCQP
jgi:hypothetical protein